MTYKLCATLLTAVFLGAHGFPTDPSQPQESQPSTGDKQVKQFNLFGNGLGLSFNHNGSLVPDPSFVKFNHSIEDTFGAGASVIVPLVPFPFGLIFPKYPPLNLTLGFTTGKNMSLILNAASGENAVNPSPSTSSDAEKRKAPGVNLPLNKPKPNVLSKPTVSIADAVAAANNAETQYGSILVENAVNSQAILVEAAEEEQQLAAAETNQDAGAPTVLTLEVVPAEAEIIPQVLTANVESENSEAEIPSVLTVEEVPAIIISNVDEPLETLVANQIEIIVPVASEAPQDSIKNLAKSRRHAGVERPATLRIEDFEDVEAPSQIAPMSPATQEDMIADVSKEEMILNAMEQMHQIVPGMQFSVARPAPINPGIFNPKPISYQNSQPAPISIEENDSEDSDDVRHSESPEFFLVGENGVIPKVPAPKPNQADQAGKNKPRPYGMDPSKNKPGKSRPTLEGGVKDKEPQHFGLPHYSSDLFQKEQMEATNPTVLGWQLPTIKWPSFTNLFQGILGNRHKGKSDAAAVAEPCVDDDETNEKDIVKSSVIQGGHLCSSGVGGVQSSCNQQCVSQGFGSGNCLGPYPTPGCLCSMPHHKEYGLMLTPLTNNGIKENVEEDLQTSDTAPCKKCSCVESCQKTGSYLGYCIADSCHCAVPWYKNAA